ncbi:MULTISPECIES: polysaccharide deacetylase family sporulation protein PdaB [unclassified Virgibacillus]|uniref:polysaccharide deacetylase family sporulation protein PdaB n=1 Tax=unclassified Virgibacillus TaxID=2620237 RepID=UPI0024DE524C|nr:polysaccharide deacetylase family sporulation protein PdaB [Virgibacillus sp. LDC-1]
MQHFYVWKFGKKARILTLILFAHLAAIFIWMETTGTLSVFSNEEPNVLAKGNEKEPNIALTFNISWGEERVEGILKQLEKEQVQATFFVSGEWAERHPELVEMIVKGKHELGTLGYRYKSYLDQEIEQVRKDLLHTKEVFKKLGYENVELLRTPNGHFNEEIVELAESIGFKVIHWNVNSHDWKNPGTQKIIDHIMKNTSNGDIILMHASDSAKQTANSLKTILPGLKNKKLSFVTITELINQAHAKAEIVD